MHALNHYFYTCNKMCGITENKTSVNAKVYRTRFFLIGKSPENNYAKLKNSASFWTREGFFRESFSE